MTELLREAIAEAPSLNSIQEAIGVQRASLMRFARGEQSLRLDIADRLADYLGIESRRVPRKRG